MTQLARLQQDFQDYLLADAGSGSVRGYIVDDAKVGAERRLAIYHDAYRLRLIEALSSAYPKLRTLLGDRLFDDTARAYIRAYPSAYRNLRWYGAAMSEHLTQALPQYPIAAELATFEWTLALAFDSADAPLLALTDMAALPPEDWPALGFVMQPALHFLPLHWNTVAVWKALDADEAPPTFERRASAECWIIWRYAFDSHFRSLDIMEESMLRLAVAGDSFGALCQYCGEVFDEQAATTAAAQYLAGWLEDGLISALKS